MTGLLAFGWAALVLSVGWKRRPPAWSARPDVEVVVHAQPARRSVLAGWGRAVQARVPMLGEVSSVVVGAAVAVAAVALFVAPTMSLLVAVGVGLLAAVRNVSRQRARTAALVRQTPAAIDLMRLCLTAGMTPRLAVTRVSGLVAEPLRSELEVVVTRTSRGEALATSMRRLAVRGHPLRPLALGVASAEESGQALGPLFERQAAEARRALRRHTEERARRLPVTMLLPLVTCVLPAFVLIVVVPMVANGLGHLV